MKGILISACLVLFIHTLTTAQCVEWNWPPDKKSAEEMVALLQDAVRDKKYKQAIKPFNWIIEHAPTLHNNIYLHGITMYDALAGKERDEVKKKIYVDSLLIVYDMRMKICGDEENVLWRKASSAFKYLINGKEANLVLSIMDSVFMKHPGSVSDGLLLSYMQTTVINHQKFKKPDEDGILFRYDLLTQMTDARIKSAVDAKRKAKLTKTRKDIDEWLFKVVKPDCEFVKANLAPRFHQNPADLELAKRVFSYMLQGKCTEDPLWLEAGEAIFKQEKGYALGKNIGLRYLNMDKITEAENYFNATLQVAPNRKDSSEVLYYNGVIETMRDNKPKAREYFQLCLALDETRKDAYERIGDLYMSSFEQCAGKERQVDDRAVYLAAYNWYVKAGNTKKMNASKQLFPSREEIFLVNYKKGDKIKVGCWINEEVVITTRD